MLLYGRDKRHARLHERRIPERSLLIAAALGPFGALVGMNLFRHKTRTWRFILLVPLLAALQVLVAALAVSSL